MTPGTYIVDIDVATRAVQGTPYTAREWYNHFIDNVPLIWCGLDLIEEVHRLGGIRPVPEEVV